MREVEIQSEIRLALASYPGLHLFRANLMGTAWQGKVVDSGDGMVLLNCARRIDSGLPDGFPDLFGYLSARFLTIDGYTTTPIFVGIEIKKTAKEKPRAEQVRFLQELYKNGGRAGVARSVEDARRILAGEFML